MKSIELRLVGWFLSDDFGISSCAIVAHMTGLSYESMSAPSDAGDLGRCLRLLKLIPEWEGRIGEMTKYGRSWQHLVAKWSELKSAMEDEVGIDWRKGGGSTKDHGTHAVRRRA